MLVVHLKNSLVKLTYDDYNFFDTSSGQSESKSRAVSVLQIHLKVLLFQKHSLGKIVCNFSCSNNMITSSCMVH